MRCVTCGTTIEQDAAFCNNCGTRVVRESTSAGQQTVALRDPYESTTPTMPSAPSMPSYSYQESSMSVPSAQLSGGYVVPQQQPVNNSLAIVSLVFGILGLASVMPIIGPLVAVITGHIARRQIREGTGPAGGNGMALAGLICGYITLGLYVFACVAFVLFVGILGAAGTAP